LPSRYEDRTYQMLLNKSAVPSDVTRRLGMNEL